MNPWGATQNGTCLTMQCLLQPVLSSAMLRPTASSDFRPILNQDPQRCKLSISNLMSASLSQRLLWGSDPSQNQAGRQSLPGSCSTVVIRETGEDMRQSFNESLGNVKRPSLSRSFECQSRNSDESRKGPSPGRVRVSTGSLSRDIRIAFGRYCTHCRLQWVDAKQRACITLSLDVWVPLHIRGDTKDLPSFK